MSIREHQASGVTRAYSALRGENLFCSSTPSATIPQRPRTPPVSPSRRRRMIASGAQIPLDPGNELVDRAPAVARGFPCGRRCRSASAPRARALRAAPRACSCVDHPDRFDVDSRCDLVIRADGEVRLGLGDQPAQVPADARRAEQDRCGRRARWRARPGCAAR